MNRLQKKCLIMTAGFHLLLVTLVCGSGFFTFTHKPKPDDTPLLTVIPANLIDAELSSGVKNAQPPPPTPPSPPEPTPPQPKPPEPKPEPVKPLEPVKPVEPVKPKQLSPDDLKPVKPVEKPVKPEPKKIEVSLKPVIHNTPKVTDTSAADAAREAAKKKAAAVAKALASINKNASSATTVEMPGTGSVSYANYASVVKSIYTQAWTPPDDTASDDANTKVSVTIGSDGTVISSRILNPSGDSRVDGSVQRTLDRVTFVAPFPDGAKEKQRTFIINFNLKAKRLLG